MPRRRPGPRGRTLSPFLSILLLLASSCVAGGKAPLPEDRQPPSDRVGVDGSSRASAGHDVRFATEQALGATCLPNYGGEPPLQQAACRGLLPDHLRSLLRNLPDDHPFLTREQREKAADEPQWFLAVQGYGERPDYVAAVSIFGSFWIRSFEGVDPATTVYMVYGPDCIRDDTHPLHVRCLAGAPATIRDIRIYRSREGGSPENVTSELAPRAPVLTEAERKRYGIYLRPPDEGDAEDADIGLDVRGLHVTPVLRWVIAPAEEGDYEKPRIPDSDPRGFHRRAHFGFLVWTGRQFELREKIPRKLWACGVGNVGDDSCLGPFAGSTDPYLTDGNMHGSRQEDAR